MISPLVFLRRIFLKFLKLTCNVGAPLEYCSWFYFHHFLIFLLLSESFTPSRKGQKSDLFSCSAEFSTKTLLARLFFFCRANWKYWPMFSGGTPARLGTIFWAKKISGILFFFRRRKFDFRCITREFGLFRWCKNFLCILACFAGCNKKGWCRRLFRKHSAKGRVCGSKPCAKIHGAYVFCCHSIFPASSVTSARIVFGENYISVPILPSEIISSDSIQRDIGQHFDQLLRPLWFSSPEHFKKSKFHRCCRYF